MMKEFHEMSPNRGSEGPADVGGTMRDTTDIEVQVLDHHPVYVVGTRSRSSGAFGWYRSAFDAGRQYERDLQNCPDGIQCWYDVIMVPAGLSGDELTQYIDDELLVGLEDKAVERGFPIKGGGSFDDV